MVIKYFYCTKRSDTSLLTKLISLPSAPLKNDKVPFAQHAVKMAFSLISIEKRHTQRGEKDLVLVRSVVFRSMLVGMNRICYEMCMLG